MSLYLGLGCGEGGSRRGGEEQHEKRSLTEKERVVLDFHYYNYAFCKERRFDACATSTFLSIMKDVFDEVVCCEK